MKFNKIIGKIDPAIITSAQNKLTRVFMELASRSDNYENFTKLGGDPMIFTLLVPIEHVATLNIPTAGTNGIRFFWNPNFINSLSLIGVRLIAYHEAIHAFYSHPNRRGKRHPILWNYAVDYIVNNLLLQDLKIRARSAEKAHQLFVDNLGNYLTLENCIKMFKNPFDPIPGIENWKPEPSNPDDKKITLPGVEEDRELTKEEEAELKKLSAQYSFAYADANLPDDMKRPEKIYDTLYALLPKCSECNRLGMYSMPSNLENKKCEEDHDGCHTCCNHFDIFERGGSTVDEHMDSVMPEEKMAKRLSDAIRIGREMAGSIPAGLEDELGILTAPKITWQDVIRTRSAKIRAGNSKNDWTKFRSRSMFAGLMIPKRNKSVVSFACLLDASGSMSREDMAYGASQMQGLDERAECTVVSADCEIYWKNAQKLKSLKPSDLMSIKPRGGGGTLFASFFTDYEKHLGKQDFLVIITDGYLLGDDVAAMKKPSCPVYWLITSSCEFQAPFGYVYQLHNF